MTAKSISPVKSKERIQVIDILRGLALLGIIMVNVHEISYSRYVTEIAGTGIDRAAEFITDAFFLNKFYTLFSFLFGLGMAVQMIRAEKKSVSFPRMYLQRLAWLLIFGLHHAIFIWDGDILATYALIGIFLLLLRNLKPKTLIALSVVLIIVQTGVNFVELEGNQDLGAGAYLSTKADSQVEIDFFRTASHTEITASRLENTIEADSPWLILLAPFSVLYIGIDVLAAFLFGLAVGKLRWFNDIEGNLQLWKNVFRWAFPIGLGTALIGAYLANLPSTSGAANGLNNLGSLLLQLGAAPMTLGYISRIVLLSRKYKSLSLFSSPGKIALTLYLSQSIILTLIFYSYGLGLFGTMGVAAAMALALAIYTIQVVFSILWMRFFLFGPFEWLWRSLTYRRFQPLKR